MTGAAEALSTGSRMLGATTLRHEEVIHMCVMQPGPSISPSVMLSPAGISQ